MSLRERVINNLNARRDKLLHGEINSIPSPLTRFRDDFVGVEQGKYYLITSVTKGGKSQFGSFMFIYNTLLYAYNHPEQLTVKIFYYPLEETPDNIMERFMSYLLYSMSEGRIRISPKDLRSTDNDHPLSEEVLNLLECDDYTDILNFFESHIIFSSSTNATGVWKECKRYAEENGTVHTKTVKVTDVDEFTGEKTIKEVEGFDYYEPNDPKEYRIIFYDHIGLTSTERGMDLRQSINKLSEYFVILRNRYGFSPVVIQQQAFFENMDAFKMDKLKPSITNLADSKAVSRDVNICLSLFSPYKYELRDYLGYDITKFRDNIRFLEVLINRDGQSNGIIGLFFDGCCNVFCELPPASDKAGIESWYTHLNSIRHKTGISLMMIAVRIKQFIKKI